MRSWSSGGRGVRGNAVGWRWSEVGWARLRARFWATRVRGLDVGRWAGEMAMGGGACRRRWSG